MLPENRHLEKTVFCKSFGPVGVGTFSPLGPLGPWALGPKGPENPPTPTGPNDLQKKIEKHLFGLSCA